LVRLRHFLHLLSQCLACVCLILSAPGLAGFSLAWSHNALASAAQTGTCLSTGPDTLVYSLRICLDSPEEGAELSGDVTVSCSVAVEWGAAPEIKHVQFYFTSSDRSDSTTVLRDYLEPYSFILPTERWSDQSLRLEMNVVMGDLFETGLVGVNVTTANGVNRLPRTTGRWMPRNAEAHSPTIVAAVGDGAGGLPASYEVTELVESWNPNMFLYFGDIYNTSSYTEFINYYVPTFGKLKDITNPVPGDHEGGRQFHGYLDYCDSSQHYYAATAGNWLLLGLDSTERSMEGQIGTAQLEWLQEQLDANDSVGCKIAFMHNPRWGLAAKNDYGYLDEMWRTLATEGVDLIIVGHEHNYQRWAPLNADGVPDPIGVTQLIVGTGGHELRTQVVQDSRVVSTILDTYGALRLTLTDQQAEYQFVDTAGTVLDSGTVSCNPDETVAIETIEPVSPTQPPPTTGTIVGTNGLRAICFVSPDDTSAVITLLPEGTQVELRGEPVGDFQPVRCADQDGYVVTMYIRPDE
jgi:hypothetical protein